MFVRDRSFYLFFSTFSLIVTVVNGQTYFVTGINYQVINIVNGGFLSVCTKYGGCQQGDWIPACYSSNANAQSVMAKSVCRKFGYFNGKLFAASQSLCFQAGCPTPDSDLSACTGYIINESQVVLYVVCYSDRCDPVGETIGGGNSFDCDFENGDSCGWSLQNWVVQSAVDPDHTVGSRQGHLITVPPCTGNSVVYSTMISGKEIGCSDCRQEYCFSFYAMNTGDQPILTVWAVYSPTQNDSLFTKNTVFNQAFTLYNVIVEVSKPFRIAVTTWCTPGSSNRLYLDDFLLTIGACPNEEAGTCYSGGTLPGDGDRCQCPANSNGRACELSFCNSASTCACPNNVNWVIIGGVIGALLLLLIIAIIVGTIVFRKRRSSRSVTLIG